MEKKTPIAMFKLRFLESALQIQGASLQLLQKKITA